MARDQGRPSSSLLKIADETVAFAVDAAAVLVLSEHDRELAKLASLEAMAAFWGDGKPQQPVVTWEREREL